jgi:hypothetical protein
MDSLDISFNEPRRFDLPISKGFSSAAAHTFRKFNIRKLRLDIVSTPKSNARNLRVYGRIQEPAVKL